MLALNWMHKSNFGQGHLHIFIFVLCMFTYGLVDSGLMEMHFKTCFCYKSAQMLGKF